MKPSMLTSADLRLVALSLWRSRATSLLIVVSLGVGFALSAVAFSLSRELLAGSLGPDSDRIVLIRERAKARGVNVDLPAQDLILRLEARKSFDGFGAWYERVRDFEVEGASRGLLRVTYLTSNSFDLVGAKPHLGALPGERAGAGVVLAFDTWKARFGADAGVVGRTVVLAGEPRTVAAVMPEGFGFPIRQDAWVTLEWADLPRVAGGDERFHLFGRLKDGATAAQGAAEIETIANRAAAAGYRNADLRTEAPPFTRGFLDPEADPAIWAAVGALALVVLVAAANVSNLLLSRAAHRGRELAVRAALGASRARLVTLILAETATLVALAGAAGLFAADRILDFARAQVTDRPYWMSFELRNETLVFVAGLGLLATLAAGLGPALRATRSARSSGWLRGGDAASLQFGKSGRRLVGAELAISVGLLTVALTLARGVARFGADAEPAVAARTVVVQVYLPGGEEADVDRRRIAIEDAFRALPGVSTTASAEHFPGNDELRPQSMELETSGGPLRIASRRVEAGAGYFDLLGSRPQIGRVIEAPDQIAGSDDVAVVNESFARALFTGDPIGRRVRDVVVTSTGETRFGPWRRVVGVVPDLGVNLGDPRDAAGVYVPLRRTRFFRAGLLVDGPPQRLTPLIYEVAQRLDRDAHVQSVSTISEQFAMSRLFVGALASIALLSGGLGFVLALASTFAQLSLAVERRTREIGIRSALGGSKVEVVRGVVLGETIAAWIGTIAGIALGAGLARVVTALPVQIEAADPALVAWVAVVACVAATVACLRPTLRALSVDPAEALRHD